MIKIVRLSPPVDIIRAVMIVWKIRGKIISICANPSTTFKSSQIYFTLWSKDQTANHTENEYNNTQRKTKLQ